MKRYKRNKDRGKYVIVCEHKAAKVIPIFIHSSPKAGYCFSHNLNDIGIFSKAEAERIMKELVVPDLAFNDRVVPLSKAKKLDLGDEITGSWPE